MEMNINETHIFVNTMAKDNEENKKYFVQREYVLSQNSKET